jgi:hypothetical protein
MNFINVGNLDETWRSFVWGVWSHSYYEIVYSDDNEYPYSANVIISSVLNRHIGDYKTLEQAKTASHIDFLTTK